QQVAVLQQPLDRLTPGHAFASQVQVPVDRRAATIHVLQAHQRALAFRRERRQWLGLRLADLLVDRPQPCLQLGDPHLGLGCPCARLAHLCTGLLGLLLAGLRQRRPCPRARLGGPRPPAPPPPTPPHPLPPP